ncbi:hypothetical protein CRG98_032274 [Punica granatum]|uniref:Uncharacterized protein n=1 Tax=Punica granatum TaxID=22663 RepID=A0A2I0ITL1_PUNGR|nr:hypothetical protein CRG98_032274 [Punica granatum]
MEESATPTPESTGDFELEFSIDSWAGAANRRPRPLHRGHRRPPWVPTTLVESRSSRSICELGLLIGDPDPSTEAASTEFPFDSRTGAANHATPTLSLRSLVSFMVTGDLG